MIFFVISCVIASLVWRWLIGLNRHTIGHLTPAGCAGLSDSFQLRFYWFVFFLEAHRLLRFMKMKLLLPVILKGTFCSFIRTLSSNGLTLYRDVSLHNCRFWEVTVCSMVQFTPMLAAVTRRLDWATNTTPYQGWLLAREVQLAVSYLNAIRAQVILMVEDGKHRLSFDPLGMMQ